MSKCFVRVEAITRPNVGPTPNQISFHYNMITDLFDNGGDFGFDWTPDFNLTPSQLLADFLARVKVVCQAHYGFTPANSDIVSPTAPIKFV